MIIYYHTFNYYLSSFKKNYTYIYPYFFTGYRQIQRIKYLICDRIKILNKNMIAGIIKEFERKNIAKQSLKLYIVYTNKNIYLFLFVFHVVLHTRKSILYLFNHTIRAYINIKKIRYCVISTYFAFSSFNIFVLLVQI